MYIYIYIYSLYIYFDILEAFLYIWEHSNRIMNDYIVSWEPEGCYYYSVMFHWEQEGRYRCTKSMARVPFWFSTEQHWTALTPFWFSAEDISSCASTTWNLNSIDQLPDIFLDDDQFPQICILSQNVFY